ncbi:MAG: hypothetical protein AB7V32_02135 [Candidatus Berkiella sp.]|uniref:Uncharacterized protein n=1 Tax=Candidatus Berkiella aquae TaxID=295108 RepID=A0A0Q9YAJ4_9GAMM|nr:hypothetical protein [Candidatus Berkiella aquae]MCS5712838.1 hypothetical protein [Candidatus Berkiella aquae]
MFQLQVKDLARIKSLAIAAKYDQEINNLIDDFMHNVADKSNIARDLTKNEIEQLSSNKQIKKLMILLFLVENVTLSFLKTRNEPYANNKVLVQDCWNQIEDVLIKRLKLSREFMPLFESKNEHDVNELKSLFIAAKTIVISDLCSEEFVSRSQNIRIRLNITGKYDIQVIKTDEKLHNQTQEEFDLYERQMHIHVGIFDAFKFVEPDLVTAFRYLNSSPTKQRIHSLITLKFQNPLLFVLNEDGTFTKIAYDEIPSFIESNYKHKEIDEGLYNAVKKDYYQLFQPSLDADSIEKISQRISHLIEAALVEAAKQKKPLLIVLSEVHGSKGSFLLHVITLIAAHRMGINHLLAETINIYHKKWGGDPLVEEMLCLLSFAEKELSIQVKDLEGKLHYNNILSRYPYYEIPLDAFGIPVREASWIIDVKAVKEGSVLIVGTAHMNNMINSELQEMYYILPIDCTCDKAFSDMLGVTQHNHIDLDKSLAGIKLDDIINMVQSDFQK